MAGKRGIKVFQVLFWIIFAPLTVFAQDEDADRKAEEAASTELGILDELQDEDPVTTGKGDAGSGAAPGEGATIIDGPALGDNPALGDEIITAGDEGFQDDMMPRQEGIYLNAPSADIRALLQQISQSERINIVAAGDVEGTVSVNLYGASLEQALEAILAPKGYAYVRKANFIYVMKSELVETFSTQPRQMLTQIYKINYLNLKDAKDLLSLYLSKDGEIKTGAETVAGIPTGDTDTGGETNAAENVLVIRDYTDVHEKVKEALIRLDARPMQVLVEATIVEVTLDDTNRLGVDFNLLNGIDFSEIDGTTSDLISITPGDANAAQIGEGFKATSTRGFTSPGANEGFSFGILKDNFSLFIDALESVTDTNVLANPKILALNRQRAEIIIGGRLGYYGAETLSEGGFSQQEVAFLETGTQLRFRPFIGNDEYIRMEIHPKRSDGVVDSVTGLPSESTSEVTTNIMVKDGDTIVIGGLIETRDTLSVSQVPILGSLPVIGWLFRKEETSTKRTEIIVMITPRIVDPAVPEEGAEELLDEYGKIKKAFRRSFKFYTRTVRGERHVDAARRAIEQEKVSLADFHLGWALHVDPHNRDVYDLTAELDEIKARRQSEDSSLEEYIWSQIK